MKFLARVADVVVAAASPFALLKEYVPVKGIRYRLRCTLVSLKDDLDSLGLVKKGEWGALVSERRAPPWQGVPTGTVIEQALWRAHRASSKPLCFLEAISNLLSIFLGRWQAVGH